MDQQMNETPVIDAAIVIDGTGDDAVAALVAAGWRLRDGEQVFAGKRVRSLEAPASDG